MAYNPQAEDISKLFDLGLTDDPDDDDDDIGNAGLDIEGLSGLQTPIINPSTPMPDLSLSSALAERRRNSQKGTSTEEVD